MKVYELMSILQKVDKNLPIATFANNHMYESAGSWGGNTNIALANTFGDIPHIIIGNFSKKGLINSSNVTFKKMIFKEFKE